MKRLAERVGVSEHVFSKANGINGFPAAVIADILPTHLPAEQLPPLP